MGKGLSGLLGLMRVAVVSPSPPSFPAPAALYRLDGDGQDASGNGLDLAVVGAFSGAYSGGRFGSAFGNGGSLGYLRSGSVVISGGLGETALTLCGWFWGDISDNQGSVVDVIIGSEDQILTLGLNSGSGDMAPRFTAPGSSVSHTAAAVSLAAWHHLALVLPGDGSWEMFVDGSSVATGTGLTADPIDDGKLELLIGDAGGDGLADDIAVVSAALTAEQIAYLAAGHQYPV